MKKIKTVAFVLVFSMLFCISANAFYRGADENGWYSFSGFLIILKSEYSNDTDGILFEINNVEAVKSAEILSEPSGDEEYCAVISVKLKDENEVVFNNTVNEFSNKNYVKTVLKNYYLGVACYYGDVDADGKVTVADARQILKFAAEIEAPKTSAQLLLSDINRDGNITVEDAKRVLQMAIEISDLIPYIK